MSTDSFAPSGGVSAALARAKLGVAPLVFTVMAAAAPLTVVAGGATAGFAVTGITGIPLGYLVVAAILAVFSIGYVAMSRKIVNAGAFYTYIAHGLGKVLGIGGSFVAVVGYSVMGIGLYGGVGVVTANFATSHGVAWPWWSWALVALALAGVLGGRRVDLNSAVLSLLLIAEIALAVVFAVIQLRHPAGGSITWTTLAPGNLIGPGLGAALVTAIAGFVGFEGTAVFSEETRDPRKTVARATYLALAVIGLLYAFCAWAMSVATGPGAIVERSTAEGSELIFNLVGPYVPQIVIELGHLLFITSLFAAALAFHNTVARYLFALGREGVLPRGLGRTSPKTKAPIAGSAVMTVISFAGIALYVIGGWDPFTRMFFWLTVLGGLGVLILMTATSIAVAAYFSHSRNRSDVGTAKGIAAPVIAAAALATVLWFTIQQFSVLLGVDATDPVRWMLPALFGLAAAAGISWALFLRSQRPDVYAEIGRGASRQVAPERVAVP